MTGRAGALLLLGLAECLGQGMSVALDPSVPPPAPVGTIVTFIATVSGASPGTLWYCFRAHRIGAEMRVVRDFGPLDSLDWTASESEGNYEIQVTARNRDTGETATSTLAYQIVSWVTGTPMISPTANPLVFLYSAPPCAAESRMRVRFSAPDGFLQSTPYKDCTGGLSMNFYLAGLRPNTTYSVTHTIDTGSEFDDGPTLTLTTPGVSIPLAASNVLTPPGAPVIDGVLLQGAYFQPAVATDLSGNLLWYYPQPLTFLTRAARGGHFYGTIVDPQGDPSRQVLREFDLAGTTVRETNAARVNEQLAALGKRQILDFHHEAAPMPGGKVVVLASTEQVLSDVQGPGPVDIIGETILVLDRNLRVVWTWDAFDHLDAHRMATLGETCTSAASGCPPLHLARQANDWVHGNSVQFTGDGNLLLSLRNQDWVLKIDYHDGEGTGDVLWRLGQGGDFQILSQDPSPWFTHQHDAEFTPGGSSILTVFDDGNVRQAADPKAHSRGQALQIDEQNRVATLVLNVDLGGFVFAMGSAQALPNGDYHFDVGFLPDNSSQAVETGPAGNIVYTLRTGTPVYRSFRMRDLYTPPPYFGAGGVVSPPAAPAAPAVSSGGPRLDPVCGRMRASRC